MGDTIDLTKTELQGHPTAGYAWKAYTGTNLAGGAVVDITATTTFGDVLNAIFKFRNSTASYNSDIHGKAINVREVLAQNVSFTVTYNNGGGTGTAVTITYTIPSPNATTDGTATGATPGGFTRAGYTFKGWATTNGASAAQIADKGALKPTLACADKGAYQLYAVWEIIKHNVSLVYNQNFTGSNAGSMPSNPAAVPVNHGANYSSTVANNTPTRTGYEFLGWSESASATTASIAKGGTITRNNITADTTITLYAVWKAYPTITYNGNGNTGGTVPTSTSAAPASTYNIAQGQPTRTGYVFAGWTTVQNNASGTKYSYNGEIAGATGVFTMPTTNVTFWALWNPQITYNANRPTDAASTTVSGMPNPATVTVTYGSNTAAATAPSLVGWTFAGWTTAANGTGTKYAAGAAINNCTTSMTLYAQWTVKGGYSIAWYDQQTAASDGTAYHTQSNLNWTASISLPSGTPTKTGYTFDGWYTQKNGDSATGTKITAVDTFNKLWQVMKTAGQATDTTTQLKVYAKWTEKDKVTLTLNPNGGNYNGTTGVYTVNNILNGGSASIPTAAAVSNPWREGYNFRGWTESSSGTGTVYVAGHTFTNMTASKVLYAKWEAADVVFTFDKNATASEVTSHKTPDPYQMTVKYGSSIAVPQGTTVYERTAYNFSKWTYTTTAGASADIAAAGASVAVANFKITWTGTSADGTLAGTATIVANWAPYTYTIAWDHNYTGRPTPTTTNNVKPTDTITQPANPTRAGYDFKGWKTVANGTGNTVATGNSVGSTWTLTGLPSGATLTAYAQWEEKKVQIRVYGDGSKAGIQYGDGSAYTAGTVIYVGAATGAIYANAGDSTPTAKNVSTGFKPLITDSSYEFNATHGSKWTKGSATGTQVSTAETLALPKTSNLYVTGDYYLTVSPKWFAYTIEYYEQNTTGSGYTKVSSPAGSGTAPFGYALQLGTTAGTNDSTKTVTVTRSDITGFTFNSAAAGSVTNLTAISATAANNVLKLYFDRNQFNVQVSYSGDVPPSMVYTPATDTKRFGETVTLTAPPTVTGYTFTGWVLKNTVSGLTAGQVKSGTFAMPNGAVVIEGVWSKVKYNVLFVNDATNGNMSGTSNYQLDYLDSLPATPTINPKDANNYYFMGWELFEGCTSTSSLSVTGGTSKGIMSVDAILGLGAEAGTPWQVTSHSRFVARFGKTVAVSYTNGGANAFGTVNGSMVANTVTKDGTYYTQLRLGWNMPGYGGSFDPSGDRNGLNPHAAPGYKFVGWEWVDVLAGNITKRAVGSYNAAKKFVLASGDALPTSVNQSYTFTAIWEETSQQIHFVNNCVNIPGVTGAPAPGDIVAKTGQTVSLPKAPAYGAATNPTGYTFMGWTTVSTGYVAGTSPLYTNTFTMTAGIRETGTYNLPAVAADGGYGVTLYPVFSENTVTILYKFATGCDSMGTLSASSEGTTFKMVSGTPNGSTPTANTGYKFVGWFKDAAHTTAVDAAWVNASTKKLTPGKESGVYKAATYYAYFEPEQYVIKFQVGDNGTWTDGTAASTDKSVTLTFNTNYGTNVPTYTGTGAAMKANTGYGFKEWAEINPTTGAVVRTISDSSLRGERVTAARTFKAIWEPRSGYTIVYNTNGGAPAVPSQQVTWNAVIDNVMPAGAKTGQAKQGYDFAGWYTKDDFSDTRIDGSGKTFEQAIAQAGITVDGDGTATLTLYAKWNEKSFTLNYAPSWPGSTTTTFPAKTVTWTQTGLLPSGYATLTETGFDFKNWNTASNATGLVVTNATSFADIYQRLYGTSDNTKTTATIYGCWGQRTFNVQFKSESGTVVKSITGVNFNDTIAYYNYAPADGSKSLLGWKYTPAGGTEQTWLKAMAGTPLSVGVFDGTPSPADGATFVLTAIMEDNAKYVINYYKVNVDANGDPVMSQAARLKQDAGFAPVGVGINIKDGTFNGIDYVTRFEMQNGSGRRADLKGYVLQTIPGATKINADGSEVTSGGTVTFNVYFVEKLFTVSYDLGADVLGNACPPTVGTPADKTVAWNSSNLYPVTTPVWEGYKAPKWQYKNATGTWTVVPTNAKLCDIAINDDNTNPIVLKALWESDVVRLVFNAQVGGIIKSTDGTITVPSGGSKYVDIDAVTGPAPTVKVTTADGYVFLGWYKDGAKLTEDETYTVTAVDGLFTSGTYEAHFRALSSINYNIKHFFEDASNPGTFIEKPELLEVRSGQENSVVNVSNDMVKHVKGFTHATGILGEKLHIAALVNGEELHLYYRVNEHDVWVSPAAPGADAPTPTPTPTYETTGITASHTLQKFGTALVLPTITAPDGWDFKWTVTYQDSDSTIKTTQTLANGANFSMPDADVNIVGTWTRLGHTVTFVAGPDAHGTVSVIAPATLPFRVNHGKNLNDPSATGSSSNIKVVADATWALAGWSYVDENGMTLTTVNPDTVLINMDTVFTALWAQTFSVIYSPGNGASNHGGVTGSDDFTQLVVVEKDIPLSANKNVNSVRFMLNGTNYDSNAPAAAGYNFIGWSWERNGTRYYEVLNTPTASYDLSVFGVAGTRDWIIDENITFTAMWEAAPQSLSFVLGAGNPAPVWTTTGAAAGTTGSKYTVSPSPRTDETVTLLGTGDISREGYTLAGWRQWVDANGDGIAQGNDLVGAAVAAGGSFTMPAHEVVFVPIWEFDSLKIRYEIEAGSIGRGTLDSPGDNIINALTSQLKGSTATANTGYKFDGWYTDAACTQRVDLGLLSNIVNDPNDPTVMISAKLAPTRPSSGWVPMTYYAKFVPGKAEYTIEYYLQGADGNYTKANITPNKFADLDTGDTADVTDATNAAYAHRLNTASGTYAGYVFNDNAFGQVLSAVVAADGTTTLKLFYDLIWYNIEYDLGTNDKGDAGTWASTPGPNRAVGGGMVVIPEARLAGMSLSGWTITWTDADGVEQSMVRGSNFQMPFFNVKATANWTKNVDFKVLVYKAEWNGNTLVATEQLVTPMNWPASFASGDGVATITVSANGTITVTAPNTQGSSFFPKTYTLPRLAGYEYIAACEALGIYNTTDAPLEDGFKVMKVYLAPKQGYKVNYVVEIDGTQRPVGDKTGVAWDDKNLGLTTLPSGFEGYELDGYGWQYKVGGDRIDVTATMSYGDIVYGIYGVPRDSVKEITLYAKIKALTYHVIFADDTNGADDPATTIVDNGDYRWTSPVVMGDPATIVTPGYSKPGYKWMGWEIRKADGSTLVKYDGGATVNYNELARLLGLDSKTALDTPVTVYAVWAEWLPVTIEFYTKDSNGEVKFLDINYTADDQKVYNGSSYTVPDAIVSANRPVGYVLDAASILSLIGDATKDNVLKVIYSEANGFKLFLNTNYGANANAQTITGLSWTSKPDSKATAAPTRIGYRLADKPQRWNTKADGTGHDFTADATYAQIAEWIYGAALDDAAILKNGLTLYAQWTIANDFEVLYDLNNDKDTNPKIQTAVPDYRNPLDMEQLNKHNVAWTDNGFDQSNDTELDAAPFGYVFTGWNTKADGTGLAITNNMTYAEISNYLNANAEVKSIKLYAQWAELEIEIKYTVDNEEAGYIDRFLDKIKAVSGEHDPNGSSAGEKLHSVAKAKPGWHFVRWEIVFDGRTRAVSDYANEVAYQGADGSTIVVSPDSESGRLYGAEYRAIFERNPEATVEYDANGGEGENFTFSTPHGSYFTLSDGSPFKRGHYTLKGWNTAADGTGTHYTLSQAEMLMPESGMKLYAEWEKNSYSVSVNEPEKGGSVTPGSTDVIYGEKIPQSFVDGLDPQPNPGWHLSGWKYTMTNAETGEVTEGFTTDLTTLTIDGPISLTPVFEGADPVVVDGPPRTGDVPFDGTLWIIALAALVACAILIGLAVLRRREEEAYEAATATYGAHSASWSDAKATRVLCTSGFGAHSVRSDGSRVSRREREAQRDCETREEFLAQAAESGIGAHAVAASADTSDDELRTSCCGAHSVAAAGRGAHSIPVLADEAACGAVERLGAAQGAHTVSKAGERVLDGLVAAYGAHSVRRADDGVWESFAAIVPPTRPDAPGTRERMARRVRGLKPRVSTAGAHEAAPVAAVVPATAAATPVTGASAPAVHEPVVATPAVAAATCASSAPSRAALQTLAIFTWLCDSRREIDGFVAYEAPMPARPARMHKRARVFDDVTGVRPRGTLRIAPTGGEWATFPRPSRHLPPSGMRQLLRDAVSFPMRQRP